MNKSALAWMGFSGAAAISAVWLSQSAHSSNALAWVIWSVIFGSLAMVITSAARSSRAE